MSDTLPPALAAFGKELFEQALVEEKARKRSDIAERARQLENTDYGFADIAFCDDDYADDRRTMPKQTA